MAMVRLEGPQNSGKTLVMTKYLFKAWGTGRDIITNYNVNFPHNRVNIDFLKKIAKEGISFPNIAYGLDEFWLEIDARRRDTVMSHFYLQSAKDDADIYITAQASRQIDVRFRENSHKILKCSRVLIIDEKVYHIDSEKRFINPKFLPHLFIKVDVFKRKTQGLQIYFKLTHTEFIHVKTMIPLYNTREKKTRTQK